MSYEHIENLYKVADILAFKKCYALEKIHGTSAHISWNRGKTGFFSGGASRPVFLKLFDESHLTEMFQELGHEKVMVYGEAYGGKIQSMSATYGKEMKFVCFEVKIGESWLAVPQAEDVVKRLGLEYVHYDLIPTDLEGLDEIVFKESIQAVRNGMGHGHTREGVVLRPTFEVIKNNGKRVIAKHKHPDFRETKAARELSNLDPAKLKVIEDANEVAEEWVTDMRLTHVLDAFPEPRSIEMTGDIIKAMVEDVIREASDEIVDSREVRAAIGRKTVQLFKVRLRL